MTQLNETGPEGFILMDKPTGMTSAYCLEKIKHLFTHRPKVGHAGTLDSFATGLLIVGAGRVATRELSQIMRLDKTYSATGKLGQLTDTLDFTGTTIKEASYENVSETVLRQAIESFGTGYHQIPPVYSALKFEGKHLSRLARTAKLSAEQLARITAEKGRDIQLYSCQLTDFKPPFFTILAHVSHGTYIRVLVNDIAQKAGSYATTHALRRLSIGPFSVQDAKTLAQLRTQDDIIAAIIPVDLMLERLSNYHSPRE